MSIDRLVMAFAGTVILVSLAVYYFGFPTTDWILIIPAFVGANLFQAAFTRFCPLAIMLKKVGAKPGEAFS